MAGFIERYAQRAKQTAKGRVGFSLGAMPLVIFGISAMVYFDMGGAVKHPVLAWPLVFLVTLYAVLWLFLLIRRRHFRDYYLSVHAWFAALAYALVISFFKILEDRGSLLISWQVLQFVGIGALAYFLFTFFYSQRRCWQGAIAHHVRKGDIDPQTGVDILAPLGNDKPWMRELERKLDNGMLSALTSFFAGLGVALSGLLKNTSLAHGIFFGFFCASIAIFIYAVSRFFWLAYYLHRYERQIGHPLMIRGL
jgi:hypothetical protein